jgi:hypothetical protein
MSTPHAGAGTTFSFGGTNFTVTSITYTIGNTGGGTDNIDVSHLGQTAGQSVLSISRPLVGTQGGDTGKTVSIEYIGTNMIAAECHRHAGDHGRHLPECGSHVQLVERLAHRKRRDPGLGRVPAGLSRHGGFPWLRTQPASPSTGAAPISLR